MPTSPRFNLITVMNLGTAGCAASDVDVHLLITRLGPNKHGSLIEHGNYYGDARRVCLKVRHSLRLFRGKHISRRYSVLKIFKWGNIDLLEELFVIVRKGAKMSSLRQDSIIVSNTWI